jgi:hypothetical protein
MIDFFVCLNTIAAYLDPPLASVALLCSFLLGFGDSCYNTQIYSMLGGTFAKKSTEAFSIFKFTQVSLTSFIYTKVFFIIFYLHT